MGLVFNSLNQKTIMKYWLPITAFNSDREQEHASEKLMLIVMILKRWLAPDSECFPFA